MDIGMPKLNGYEAARRIRQETWGEEMVLVATTGWGQAEDRRRSQEAGFDQHLVKPIDPTIVAELLSDVEAITKKGRRRKESADTTSSKNGAHPDSKDSSSKGAGSSSRREFMIAD
jgi:DNA-binding response OmpR family regulator